MFPLMIYKTIYSTRQSSDFFLMRIHIICVVFFFFWSQKIFQLVITNIWNTFKILWNSVNLNAGHLVPFEIQVNVWLVFIFKKAGLSHSQQCYINQTMLPPFSLLLLTSDSSQSYSWMKMGREDLDEVIISECDNYIMIRGQDVDAAGFDRWNLKHKIIYWVLLSMVIAWNKTDWIAAFL